MTQVGEDWDEEPIEAIREGWVVPRAPFGDFITEQGVSTHNPKAVTQSQEVICSRKYVRHCI
jgi:hypothetical protein